MIYNDIIGVFMGGSLTSTEKCQMPHGSCHNVIINKWDIPLGIPHDKSSLARIGLFSYHNDWNTLIPVIDYIETLEVDEENFRFIFHKNTCIVEAQWKIFQPSEVWHTHLKVEGNNKMEAAYNAVGQLILSFNKIKKNGFRKTKEERGK